MHCNLLFDLTNNVFVDLVIHPKQEGNERKASISILKRNTFEKKLFSSVAEAYPSRNIFTNFKHMKNADFLIRYPNVLYVRGNQTSERYDQNRLFYLHIE